MRERYLPILLIFFVFIAGCLIEIKEIDTDAVMHTMTYYVEKKINSQGGTYEIKRVDVKKVDAKFDHFHPGLSRKRGHLVSCADFTYGIDVYDIDFYVKIDDGPYRVVKEVLHKKNGQSVNEVLWLRDQ